MPYVMAAPDMMAAAATDVAAVGSTLSAAHIAAAAPTVAVIPAAADEVSASIAHLFSQHAQGYQALAGQAAAFHEQIVQHLSASARSYAAPEAASAVSLGHLNASAGSSASAIAALPGQLLNTLTSQLTAFLTALKDIAYYAHVLGYLVIRVLPYLLHVLGYLVYHVVLLLLQFELARRFGV